MQTGATPKAAKTKKVGKTDLRRALEEHGGIISRVADAYSVTRQTVYNWIEHYELHDKVQAARKGLFDLAVDNVAKAVQEGDLEMSRFVLTHMPTTARWSSRSEITGKDGTPLVIAPDVMEILRGMGVQDSDLAKQFEDMIREMAKAKANG